MQRSVRLRLLKRLTAIAVAAAFGVIDPAVSLLDIPERALTNIFNEDPAGSLWESEEHGQVVRLLSRDPRPSVRMVVAESVPAALRRSPEEAHAVIRSLSSDVSARVRHAAAKGLAALLLRASPIDRVEMVCQWTVSPLATERAAIARALSSPTPVLVADLAIEQLSLDTDPVVRLGAVRAAAKHWDESAELYGKLASRLRADPNRLVRRAAIRLYEQA